jgi:hypothetical protein
MVRLNLTILILFCMGCGLKPGGDFPGLSDKNEEAEKPPSSDDALADRPGELEDLPPLEEEAGLSLHSKIRMKNADQLARDLEGSLELDAQSLCKELGELSCIDEVHKISLGGVDPYDKNIYNGRKDIGLSTPLVIERIVLSACEKRVEIDFSGGALIFTADRKASVRNLIERAFLRDASEEEIAGLAGAFVDSDETTWAVASCFAVLSSSEFLFY